MAPVDGELVGGYLLRKRGAVKEQGTPQPGARRSTSSERESAGGGGGAKRRPSLGSGTSGGLARAGNSPTLSFLPGLLQSSLTAAPVGAGPSPQEPAVRSQRAPSPLPGVQSAEKVGARGESSQLAAEQERHAQDAAKIAELEARLAELQSQLAQRGAQVAELQRGVQQQGEETARQRQAMLVKLQHTVSPGTPEPSDAGSEAVAEAAVERFVEAHASLKRRLQAEASERARLHNALIDLKGAIRVFCRVRPEAGGAAEAPAVVCRAGEQSVRVSCPRAPAAGFSFDAVFPPEAGQAAVWAEARPVVAGVLDGYSATVFAYGQTGSGKTHSMQGSEDDRGLSFRALAEVFRLAHARSADCEYAVQLSMVEVYLEQVRDLLADGGTGPERLEVRGGGSVPGLTQAPVAGVEQAWQYLQRGQRARATAATAANDRSSRSHCLLCLRVRGRSKLSGDCWAARLWLCDLAGSERLAKSGAEGLRLREAQAINRSLSALGDCISALASRAPHVPFRNSKLTFLLQDSLAGNSKMVMLVAVAPGAADAPESLCSLQFAARMRGVELGPARRTADAGPELRELREQLAALQGRLGAADAVRAQLAALLQAREADAAALREELAARQQAHAQELSAARRAAARREAGVAPAQQREPPPAATPAKPACLQPVVQARLAVSKAHGLTAGASTALAVRAAAARPVVRVPASAIKLPASAFKGSSHFNASRPAAAQLAASKPPATAAPGAGRAQAAAGGPSWRGRPAAAKENSPVQPWARAPAPADKAGVGAGQPQRLLGSGATAGGAWRVERRGTQQPSKLAGGPQRRPLWGLPEGR